jgi:hypothetical protein
MIEITRDDATVLVAAIDYMTSIENTLKAMIERLADAGLVSTPAPEPPHPDAIEQVMRVRAKLAQPGPGIDPEAQRVLRTIRDGAGAATTAELYLSTRLVPDALKQLLEDMTARGWIRALQNGTDYKAGTFTLEITEAGEQQL